MKSRQGRLALVLVVGLFGAAIFWFGYVSGQSNFAPKPPTAAPVTATISPPSPAAAARPAMKKAEILRQENAYAYEQTYLNRQYKVTGKIRSVVGRNQMWPSKFTVDLETWNITRNPYLSMPRVTFENLSSEAMLSVRPGQEIDATCVLTDWMEFTNCRLNRPVKAVIHKPVAG